MERIRTLEIGYFKKKPADLIQIFKVLPLRLTYMMCIVFDDISFHVAESSSIGNLI